MKGKLLNKTNLKKIISTILVFLIILMQGINLPIIVKASDTYEGLKLEANKITSLNVGDIVEITISTDGEPIGSIDGLIMYDFSIFEQLTTDDIECLQDDWSVDVLDYNEEYYGEETGYLILSNYKGKSSTGDIAKITLTVKQTTDKTELILSDVYIVLDDTTSVGPLEDMVCEIKPINIYSITYNSNAIETVTGMPSNGTKEEDVDYTVEAGPTREGYSFIEWNTKQDGSGTKYIPGNTYSTNENLTLYAQWKKQTTLTVNPNGGVWEGSSLSQTFTQNEGTTKTINNPTTTPNGNRINFNANGGTYTGGQIVQATTFDKWEGATLSGTTYTFGTSNATLTANYVGDEITLPIATKEGATFLGWKDVTGKLVGKAGESYAPEYTTPNAIITLTATYEDEPKYILTIDANGGIYNGDIIVEGKENEEIIISNPTEPNGYIVTLDNNDETGTTNQEIQTYTFDKWIIVSGAGTISGTTYTFAKENGEIIAEYTANPIQLSTPSRQGYTFKGWNTKEDGSGTNYAGGSPYMPTSNITLYAQWIPNIYTITFEPGESGIVDTSIKTVTYGQKYGTLPTPTKEGYTFKNWQTEDGTIITEDDIVNTISDITLRAEYEISKYFVTFKNDDGTEIKTIKVEYGSDAKFNGELPKKEGVPVGYEATFTGWDNEADLKNITQDVTVTATYEVLPIVYTITYYNLKDADNSKNITTYTIEDENFNLENLEDQGKYIFKGWYTSNAEDAEKVTSIDTSKLGNIVLYAQWENDELYLASEKYKVGENDIDNYEVGDIYLDKIEPNTTVAQLIDNCDTNGTITVIDEDGNILEEDDLVGTKMTIKVTRYDEQITLTAIVMGDINGDGKVTATDLSTLNQTILYKNNLEEPRFKAADLDDNEKLTATDLSTINNTILGTINLTYSKKQAI